ncbi:MAG: glycoside hydrolase family 27 protein [Nocardiopsaceae bacterium]|nr:glycoside hydrolase family 27 protein [Nocardiopsaceae bacterium]
MMRIRIAAAVGSLITAVTVAVAMTTSAAHAALNAPGAARPSGAAHALDAASSAFGQLPVMGYNTWYQFGAGATQSEVLAQADYLVSSGLAAAGYDTVNLDDGWTATSRTSDGSLTWNTTRYPNGIPWLASQIHALGLKFGIYEAIGTRTCQGLPGSGGTTAAGNHYAQDARTFADWGVDFVKIDECGGLPSGTTLASLTSSFEEYGADLRAANPNVVYSEELPIYVMGQPGFTQSVQSSSTFANMWRVAYDESPADSASDTILGHLASDLPLYSYARPGHWNDLDMLVPGTVSAHPFGWSLADEESQLSVWAEEASPLLISTDLTTLTPDELAALKNPNIIAIDQSGSQASKSVTSADGNIEAVFKQADGGTAVLFANLNTTASSTEDFTLSQLGISAPEATGYNVWKNETTTFSGIHITLPPGGTETMVIKPVSLCSSASTPIEPGNARPQHNAETEKHSAETEAHDHAGRVAGRRRDRPDGGNAREREHGGHHREPGGKGLRHGDGADPAQRPDTDLRRSRDDRRPPALAELERDEGERDLDRFLAGRSHCQRHPEGSHHRGHHPVRPSCSGQREDPVHHADDARDRYHTERVQAEPVF